MLCIRPTRYEYDQNLKKKHQNFSVRQRFTYIFIRCHCWLKRQGVTGPLGQYMMEAPFATMTVCLSVRLSVCLHRACVFLRNRLSD